MTKHYFPHTLQIAPQGPSEAHMVAEFASLNLNEQKTCSTRVAHIDF